MIMDKTNCRTAHRGINEMSEHETGQSPSEDEIFAIINSESTADVPSETILDIVTDQIAQEDANPPVTDDWFRQCPLSTESQQAVIDLVLSDWAGDDDVTPPTEAELDRIYRQDAGLDIPAEGWNADHDLNLVKALAAVLTRESKKSKQYAAAATGLRDIVNTGQYSTEARKIATATLREHSIRLGEPSPPEPQNSAAYGLAVALSHYAANNFGVERENALARLRSMADDDKRPIDARNEARRQLESYLTEPSLNGIQSTRKLDLFSGAVPEAFALSLDKFLPLVRSTFSGSPMTADLWIREYRAHHGIAA